MTASPDWRHDTSLDNRPLFIENHGGLLEQLSDLLDLSLLAPAPRLAGGPAPPVTRAKGGGSLASQEP